jgi:hypothetical protein
MPFAGGGILGNTRSNLCHFCNTGRGIRVGRSNKRDRKWAREKGGKEIKGWRNGRTGLMKLFNAKEEEKKEGQEKGLTLRRTNKRTGK